MCTIWNSNLARLLLVLTKLCLVYGFLLASNEMKVENSNHSLA